MDDSNPQKSLGDVVAKPAPICGPFSPVKAQDAVTTVTSAAKGDEGPMSTPAGKSVMKAPAGQSVASRRRSSVRDKKNVF